MTDDNKTPAEEEVQQEEGAEEAEEEVQPVLKAYVREQMKQNDWVFRQFEPYIPHTSMRAIVNPHYRVGEKLLKKLSNVLNLPMQTLLEWGELLPEADEVTQQRRHLGHVFQMLSPERKDQLMNFALFLLGEQNRED